MAHSRVTTHFLVFHFPLCSFFMYFNVCLKKCFPFLTFFLLVTDVTLVASVSEFHKRSFFCSRCSMEM